MWRSLARLFMKQTALVRSWDLSQETSCGQKQGRASNQKCKWSWSEWNLRHNFKCTADFKKNHIVLSKLENVLCGFHGLCIMWNPHHGMLRSSQLLSQRDIQDCLNKFLHRASIERTTTVKITFCYRPDLYTSISYTFKTHVKDI